jgi:hypothetical protein
MMDQKFCDERHDGINRVMSRIESKVDTLVWKVLGVTVAIVGLLFTAMKLVGQ